MNIIIYKEASNDIKQIYEYISQDSSLIALKFLNKLLDYISYLSLFPELGRLVIPKYNVRKLIYRNYIILYQINYLSYEIHVLTIFHSKKDIEMILKNIQKFL